jgi:hypothetical protein
LAYFHAHSEPDPEADLTIDGDELVDFASDLLTTDPSHGFIFKGMENVWDKVSQPLRINKAMIYMMVTDSESELGLSSTP